MKFFLLACLLAGALSVDAVPAKIVPSTTPIPVSQKKVEVYVDQLRRDLEAQEKDLGGYLLKAHNTKKIKEQRLKTLEPILSHLSEQLRNTTKFYNVYNKYVDDEKRVLKPFTIEYDRALSLYNTTNARLVEERAFLDSLAQYIKRVQSFRLHCPKR
jgi:CHASE3 domain sensor protein